MRQLWRDGGAYAGTCEQFAGICPGRALFQALKAEIFAEHDALRILSVACLAVCDRPVTIAFQSPGRRSYVVGGIDPEADVANVILAARAVVRSPSGVPAMSERPPFFRKGVIYRLPPYSSPGALHEDS